MSVEACRGVAKLTGLEPRPISREDSFDPHQKNTWIRPCTRISWRAVRLGRRSGSRASHLCGTPDYPCEIACPTTFVQQVNIRKADILCKAYTSIQETWRVQQPPALSRGNAGASKGAPPHMLADREQSEVAYQLNLRRPPAAMPREGF